MHVTLTRLRWRLWYCSFMYGSDVYQELNACTGGNVWTKLMAQFWFTDVTAAGNIWWAKLIYVDTGAICYTRTVYAVDEHEISTLCATYVIAKWRRLHISTLVADTTVSTFRYRSILTITWGTDCTIWTLHEHTTTFHSLFSSCGPSSAEWDATFPGRTCVIGFITCAIRHTLLGWSNQG
jgi:hypothetical protein